MSEHTLFPTPTRLKLLAEVDAGQIRRHPDGRDRNAYIGSEVTARIADMERAGWVEVGYADIWGLTAKGRAVKDGAGGERRA